MGAAPADDIERPTEDDRLDPRLGKCGKIEPVAIV
jgi:hypothetical protein